MKRIFAAFCAVILLTALPALAQLRGSDLARLVSAENKIETLRAEGGLTDASITEADLKAVDSASDEDFLTYEGTTGDFEWHSVADKAASFAAAIAKGELANGIVVDADVAPDAAIAHSKLATDGIGDPVAAAASSAEVASALVVTTITLTNCVMVATDTSDEGESTKIFDFDAGGFCVLGVIVNASCVTSAGVTNTFVMSLGTAAAADDSGLTGTEVDFCPSTTLDTTAGTVHTNAFDAVLASPAFFDGTATAKDLYLNFAVDDDNMDQAVTNTVTGTITIISTKAVDNQ